MVFFWSADSAFRNFMNFWGRSGRSEFWFWQLYANLLLFLGSLGVLLFTGLDGVLTPLSILNLSVLAVLLLPSLAVSVRRLHDINRRGWWLFIYFVPLVGPLLLVYFFVQPSDEEPNRYGPVPQPGSAT